MLKEKKVASEKVTKLFYLLSSSRTDRYMYTGILMDLVLSKEVFLHNPEIVPFLKYVYDLSYREYVIGSRTNICARLIRHLENLSDSDIRATRQLIISFIVDNFDGLKVEPKLSSSISNYQKWLEGIK